MEEEFRAKRKILITGLPLDCNEKVSQHDFITPQSCVRNKAVVFCVSVDTNLEIQASEH